MYGPDGTDWPDGAHGGDGPDGMTAVDDDDLDARSLLTLFGDNFLDGYTSNTDHYKALGSSDKEAAYKKEVMNRFLAALFLRNSDQGRYGTLAFKY